MEFKKIYFLLGSKIEDEAEAKKKALMYLKGEGGYNIELLERTLTAEELFNVIRRDFNSSNTWTARLGEGYALMRHFDYLSDDNRDVTGWSVVKVYKTETAARRAFNKYNNQSYKVQKGFYRVDECGNFEQ